MVMPFLLVVLLVIRDPFYGIVLVVLVVSLGGAHGGPGVGLVWAWCGPGVHLVWAWLAAVYGSSAVPKACPFVTTST